MEQSHLPYSVFWRVEHQQSGTELRSGGVTEQQMAEIVESELEIRLRAFCEHVDSLLSGLMREAISLTPVMSLCEPLVATSYLGNSISYLSIFLTTNYQERL